MIPERKLMDPDASDLERQLLSAWHAEPSAESKQALLAGLGLAATGGVVGTSIAPKAASLVGWSLAKWSLLAIVPVVVASFVVWFTKHETPQPLLPLVITSAPTQMASVVLSPPAVTVREIAVTTLPSSAPPIAVKTAAIAHSVESSETLAAEVAALDRARSAVAHDPAQAQRLVNDYESGYPAGIFTQEAEVIRIEALSKLGNQEDTELAAKKFLMTYPKSPHADRVRSFAAGE